MQKPSSSPIPAKPDQANVVVRLAQLSDKASLTALIELSVRNLQHNDYSQAQLEAMLTYVYGVDTQLIADGTYYLVEIENQLAGAGGWSQRKTLFGGDQAKKPAEDNLLNPDTDAAKIRAFFVHPQWARRGVGLLLMQTCEAAAHQAGFRQLELMATLTGEPLYRVSGFETLERVEISLPGEITAPLIRMTKRLI